MSLRDAVIPARMERVAVVAPTDRLPEVLDALADAGVVELEGVSPQAPLQDAEGTALRHRAVAAMAGWSPRSSVPQLRGRLAPLGGSVTRLARPRGIEPPTLTSGRGASGVCQPLVDTYATLPYEDLNPAVPAGIAYVLMFGMMFGDVGHGALLVAAGLLLRAGRPRALARLSHLAPFVIGGGLAAMVFGFAYGEAFGPTHLVPTLWLAPLDHATTLLAVAVAAGAVLIALSYVAGTVNRWREGGGRSALLATSGIAGALTYLGLALVVAGWFVHLGLLRAGGVGLAATGIALGFVGCYSHSGSAFQAGVELFDSVLRIGTNTVSFARLAAFGLTHAALCGIVWSGTDGLWHRGPALWAAAVVLFVVGNVLAFALEGLVAGVQALRLEYYELFSRIFVAEGRPFRPWHGPGSPPSVSSLPASPSVTSLPASSPSKEVPCSPG